MRRQPIGYTWLSYTEVWTHPELALFLGHLLVGATETGLCYLNPGAASREKALSDLQKRFPKTRLVDLEESSVPNTCLLDTFAVTGIIDRFKQALQAYAAGQPDAWLSVPLDIQGTDFQKVVWQHLVDIPYGRSVSYAHLAETMGVPKAIRAVANACGANKLAIIIPCHRVLRSNGDLGGFRWGLAMKQALLEREQQYPPVRLCLF